MSFGVRSNEPQRTSVGRLVKVIMTMMTMMERQNQWWKLVLTKKMKMMNCGDDCDYDVLWCWLIRDDGSETSYGKTVVKIMMMMMMMIMMMRNIHIIDVVTVTLMMMIRITQPTEVVFTVFLTANFISRLNMIVRVKVALNGMVVDSDWCFNSLCGSHLQSQSELYHVSWWC